MPVVRRAAAAIAVLCLTVLAACGGASPQARDLPEPSGGRVSSTSSDAGKGHDKDKSEGKDDPKNDSAKGGGGKGGATEDDQKTFAYATSDSAQLARELAEIGSTIEALYAHAAAHETDALQSDAQALLSQAAVLEGDARNAANRLGNLSPSDPILKDARADGVSAFSLTAEYAGAVVDLANAALSTNMQQMASVAQDAASLQGTSDDLGASYTELAQELEQWAGKNPQAAAAATAKYHG